MDKKQNQISRVKILTALFTAYGQGDDGNRIAVYAKAFDGMPIEILDAACQKCLYEKTFLPAVAEILQAAQNLVEESQETRQKSWGEALAEIEARMHDYYLTESSVYTGDLEFSTKEITDTVKAIGWRNLCFCAAKDYPTVRAQTRKIYEDLTKRKRDSAVNMLVMGQKRLVELGDHMKLLY